MWLKDVTSGEKPAFFPFGGGARVCPGQAYAKLILKLFAIELARTSSLELIQDSELSFWPTPKPINTILVKVHDV